MTRLSSRLTADTETGWEVARLFLRAVRQKDMVMSPAELGTENYCTDEDQQ
jgi:hypothetical protein